MSEKTAATAEKTTEESGRKRFSFGPVWTQAVIDGKVKDHEKLIAHGVKLKVGSKTELKKLKFETLLGKVATAIEDEKKTEKADA